MCPSPPLDASVPTARAKRYDLVAGCYPANATIVQQLQEKHLEVHKDLFLTFVDLEEAYGIWCIGV